MKPLITLLLILRVAATSHATNIRITGTDLECTGSSDVLLVGMNAPTTSYCAPTFTNAVEPICLVQFAGINNSTISTVSAPGDAHYMDYSALAPANVLRGSTYPITVSGNTDGNYTNYITAFFDWDQDGVFEDAQQIGPIGNTNCVALATTNITVPLAALPGTTRMRIIKDYAPIVVYPADPCGNYGYGQAEDYAVTVFQPACDLPEATASVTQVSCGNMSYSASLEVSSIGDATGVDIISSIHGTIASGVGIGSYPSLPTGLGVMESFTVAHNDVEACTISVDPITSYGPACPAMLVPFSGGDLVPCGSNTILRDHADGAEYGNNADGFVVLQANGTATMNISGSYAMRPGDQIRIYDGAGTGSLLNTRVGTGTLNYTGAPGQTITVRFSSNGSLTDAGFEFVVTYTGACACLAPIAIASLADDCDNMNFTATVDVSALGDATSVNIISDIHGTIASGVGPGSYPSLPNQFWTYETLTVVSSDDAACNMTLGQVTSAGIPCPVILVPYSGSNAVPCGTSSFFLRDHADNGHYNSYAEGLTVLEATGTVVIHLNGGFNLVPGSAWIRIYDGAGIGGTLLQTHAGIGTVEFSGAPGQTITVRFTSNSGSLTGFSFTVMREGECACPEALATVTDDCGNMEFTATVDVSSIGNATGVDIISSIHGTIASGVGAGSYPSLPNAFGIPEGFTVVHIGNAGCDQAIAPITSIGPACPAILVPFNGGNTVSCGNNTLLRDHGGVANYDNHANGYMVLEASVSSAINISGNYALQANYDVIRIYDGVGIGGALLQAYAGTGMANFTGALGQSLTVHFISDQINVGPGFDFLISYSGVCICPPLTATASVTDDCSYLGFAATVDVSSIGDATGVDIISSIHGTIASAVGIGSYPSLPNAFGTPESFTLVNNDSMECSLNLGPITSTNSTCPVLLVPFSGGNTVDCGTTTFLRDHADGGHYSNNANGYTVLEANGTASITISGSYATGNGLDFIRIYDGTGTGGTVLSGYIGLGTAYFAGAPGQTVTVGFTSDGGGVNFGFDFMVIYTGTCTCSPPTAASAVAPDCSNAQFYVDVDITSLGDASQVDIVANGSVVVANVTSTGVEQIGPFASGSSVSITIVNDGTEGCWLDLPHATYTCPPPPDPFDCPLLSANIGDPCDDVDPCTQNGSVDAICACVGIPLPDTDGDGLCDAEDECPYAMDGIANFNENTCACDPGYLINTIEQNGHEVIISCDAPPCGIVPGTPIVECQSITAGEADTYRVIIPYTGIQEGVTVLNNSGSGIVEGNDPAVVSNGTIQINSISELDDYSVTFSWPCGSYTISGSAPTCAPPPLTLVINEVDYDNPGNDNDEWIELYNYGPDPVNPLDIRLLLVNGLNGGGAVYQTIIIGSPLAISPGGYFILGNNTLNPAVDHVVTSGPNLIQNGAPDAIALTDAFGNIIDVISYEGNTAAPYIEGMGFTGGDDNVTVGKVIARLLNGNDTNDNNADWQEWCATPGASNDSAPDDDEDGIPNCIDPCPLALNGIANFDVITCSCEPGFDVIITIIGDNDVITACSSNFDCPLLSADIGTPCDDGNPDTDGDVITNDCVCAGVVSHVLVSARVYLEGCYDAGIGLMRDDLRVLGLVPIAEPYTALGHGYVNGGGETTAPSVLATTGDDAIVDWVIVELRDKDVPSQVLYSRSALVQCDGDVVDVDGVSAVGCPLPGDAYHVAILHRNHLACMTAQPVQLGTVPTAVDLTAASTPTYGTTARKSMSGIVPVEALWAGDVNFDGQVRYAGSANDRDPILQTIGGSVPTNTTSGQYRQEDVNMDGVVRYAGSGNDRDPILQNIGGVVPTNTRVGQLP